MSDRQGRLARLRRGVTGRSPERPVDEDRSPFWHRRPIALLTLILGALGTLYMVSLLVLRPASPGAELDLDLLVDAALEGRVDSARFLDQDARITGDLVTADNVEAEYWTSYPSSDVATSDLLDTFLSSGAGVSVDAQVVKEVVRFIAQFLLPLVVFANLSALMFAVVRGGRTERSNRPVEDPPNPVGISERRQINFQNVAAADEAIAELAEVRDYLLNPSLFHEVGAIPPKGVLIAGPPGCGKTLLARAVAGEAKASFYSTSASRFFDSTSGVGARRVQDLFHQARASAPSIIFIDEIDAVGRHRAGGASGQDDREQTLNELLVQMDGFTPSDGVAVIAATNRPDLLDPALMRAGRFDRHIHVERPDRSDRLAILRLHALGKRLAHAEQDLPSVAMQTPGFTGADLANVLNEAALLALREGKPSIEYGHLDEAVERASSGPKRRATVLPVEERRRIACHEAGHGVVAAALGKAGLLQKLSVVARGRGVEHLAQLHDERRIVTRHDLRVDIAIALGGLVAEELIFGDLSTSSEVDLERATELARDMAGRYGMSAELGRARLFQTPSMASRSRGSGPSLKTSEPILEQLDLEVRRILAEQEDVAKSILVSNVNIIEALAGALVDRETVQGVELETELASIRTYATPRLREGDRPEVHVSTETISSQTTDSHEGPTQPTASATPTQVPEALSPVSVQASEVGDPSHPVNDEGENWARFVERSTARLDAAKDVPPRHLSVDVVEHVVRRPDGAVVGVNCEVSCPDGAPYSLAVEVAQGNVRGHTEVTSVGSGSIQESTLFVGGGGGESFELGLAQVAARVQLHSPGSLVVEDLDVIQREVTIAAAPGGATEIVEKNR